MTLLMGLSFYATQNLDIVNTRIYTIAHGSLCNAYTFQIAEFIHSVELNQKANWSNLCKDMVQKTLSCYPKVAESKTFF